MKRRDIVWWPVWEPVPGRFPWRLKNLLTGELLRTPPQGRLHKAYVFRTAEEALRFLKSRLGQKAVKENEKIKLTNEKT